MKLKLKLMKTSIDDKRHYDVMKMQELDSIGF